MKRHNEPRTKTIDERFGGPEMLRAAKSAVRKAAGSTAKPAAKPKRRTRRAA
jgi:hypothetical protein